MSLILKDPAAVLDYSVDWKTSYLADETLASSNWSVVPLEAGGVTIDGTSYDGDSASVHVSGGLAGKIYRLINTVVTNTGREDCRSILMRVENR